MRGTGMQQWRRVAAIIGVLLAMAFAAGWLPASGLVPEGEGGVSLNVTPSDDLPLSKIVTVTGEGFVGDVYGGGKITVVQVAQCATDFGCGVETQFTVSATGQFTGTMVVVRMLSLSDTTVDCAELTCEVRTLGPPSVGHHLTFSTELPTTTTKPRVPPVVDTTTTVPVPTTVIPTTIRTTPTTSAPATTATPTTRPAPPTTLRPAPRATIPPTTKVTVPATSTSLVAPASTVAPSSTTTTSVPPTGDRPTLIAVTPKNEPAGPPGGGLHVQGTGYTCDTVYFFFDGTRVGSGTPDGVGNVSKGGLSVPGDTGRGPHKVTSSCDPSGATVMQASMFEVLPVTVHRPAFVTSLPLPSQISLAPGQLLSTAAIALGAIILIGFPFELFNSTIEENYDEIRGWLGMGPRKVPVVTTRSHYLSFFGLTALSAITCGFLSPDFGLNRTSVVLFVGIFIALIVMAVLFSVPADIGIRRQFGEWGKLNFLPATVLVSVVLVLLSRVLHFQPGYFYGALAGLAFRSALSEKVQGKMTAANWLFSLAISVAAFFLRAPVSAHAAEPGSSIWWIGLEICLAMIFLWGVEGLAVAMLPMKFLDGRKVFRWNKAAWAALFFLGIFATVQVLLRPGSGYVGETSGEVSIGVMSLFALFGASSVGLWAYFRFRPERWVPVPVKGLNVGPG